MTVKQDQQMTNKGRKLLSIGTISERTDLSRASVYKLFDMGLPSVKIGKSRRVFEHDLDLFMDNLTLTKRKLHTDVRETIPVSELKNFLEENESCGGES